VAFCEVRQDSLDDEDFFEALHAKALGLEDFRHAPLAEALEQSIATKRNVHCGSLRELSFLTSVRPEMDSPRANPVL
jgi:hypothetical protein